jgi:hypothetical protein
MPETLSWQLSRDTAASWAGQAVIAPMPASPPRGANNIRQRALDGGSQSLHRNLPRLVLSTSARPRRHRAREPGARRRATRDIARLAAAEGERTGEAVTVIRGHRAVTAVHPDLGPGGVPYQPARLAAQKFASSG